jgi:multiple sugar transport system substrate-binding protein
MQLATPPYSSGQIVRIPYSPDQFEQGFTMNAHRLSTVVTSLAALAMFLTGCQPVPTAQPTAAAAAQPTTAPAAEKVTIRWGIYADPGRQAAAEAQVADFEAKNPNIDVKVEAVPFADYYNKLPAQILSNTVYDVFMMSGANFQKLAPQGPFEDLGPLMQQAGFNLDDYTVEPDNSRFNGKLYALPYELDIHALFYNKDLFDKAGLKYPDDTWTWNTLRETARKLTITQGDQTTQWGFYSENLYRSWLNFIYQNGGTVLNADKSKGTIAQPETVDALKFMVDLVQKDKVSPAPGQLAGAASPFQTGRVAMEINGSYSIRPYNDITAFKWDIAPLPQGKQRADVFWTQALVMSAKSQHMLEASAFIRYLMSDDGQALMAKTKMATPSKKSVAASAAYTQGPPANLKVFVDSYAYGKGIPFTANWFDVMAGGTSAMAKEFDLAWLGKESVEDAARNADVAVDKLMQG